LNLNEEHSSARAANVLLQSAKETTRDWPPEEGVLFATDETPAEKVGDLEFWRTMNLQREAWGALKCHVVFFLLPSNYRLLLTVANHLADCSGWNITKASKRFF
jgi:hypothetical protein